MKTKPSIKPLFIAGLAILLAACQPKAPVPSPNTAPAPAQTTATPSQETAAGPAQASGGPGDFNLDDPSVGLESLSSYRQSLVLSFDGTLSAKEMHSKTSLRRTVTTQPGGQVTWRETGSNPPQMFATVGDVSYQLTGEQGVCSASLAEAGPGTAALFQLQTLPAVHGALDAGPETVNGIATQHYTFDEQALGQAGQLKAAGEMWIAKEGGYVVQYSLRIEGDQGQLGPDTAGAQTWEYQLSDANTVSAPDLPDNCANLSGTAGIPLPDQAQTEIQQPGFVRYFVELSPAAVGQFYLDQAGALGWTAIESDPLSAENPVLNFRTQDGGLVNLSLASQGQGTRVTCQSLAPMPGE